jgi:uncharacterized repeat protein (TIGR01451 family)
MACAAALLSVVTCTDATDVELLEIGASGALVGQVYIDLDRSGSVEAADRPLADTEVILSAAASSATIATATTDANGVFFFDDVPAGSYRLRVDDAVLGDSLATLTTLPVLEVSLGDTLATLVGVSYPELTIEELRAAEPGRRVFTTGIALNVRDNPADGRVFLEGESAFLQAVGIPRQPNVSVGDSVRFLGRTVVRDGQPMLQGDSVPTAILVSRAKIPTAQTVSTEGAATAGGGPLDAALVRVNHAEISDTATVGEDFLFTADDGSGPVRVVLRPFLARSTDDLRPDTTVRVARVVGMLSPHDPGTGAVAWRLLVRSAGELVTETRRADLSVTASFAPTSASQGETVELRVVVTNAGPLAANGVEVSDTLSTALSRQSSSATQGSYSSTGTAGTWTLDRIEPGAADTLTVTVEVTGAGTGTVPYVARVGGLETEVDPNDGNNGATSALTLTAP